MIVHYDLFAGIGGFSLAVDKVFYDQKIKHIFCEWESFPTAVLKKHWPQGEFWGDIADLVTHTRCSIREQRADQSNGDQAERSPETDQDKRFTLLTGGFPCQPFSAAGQRKGTADDRYKWPEMFGVIQNVKPNWVIAENVRGLVSWSDGMVLEQVCADLESEGYEVQPIIIPACAVNAPHRRDRVWIIAHFEHNGESRAENISQNRRTQSESSPRTELSESKHERISSLRKTKAGWQPNWETSWQGVAATTCDVELDDGLSRIVDGVSYSRAKWRRESLKAYGNAIVPQVAIKIFEAIRQSYQGETK